MSVRLEGLVSKLCPAWIDCQRSVYGLYVCTFPPVGELLPLMHNSFREHLWPMNSILFWSLFVSSQAIVNMFSVWEIFFKLQFEELSLSMSPSCCCSPASSDLTFVCAYVRTARGDHRPDHHASLVEEHLQNKICFSGFGGLGVVFNIWAPQVKAWPCFAERCELFSLSLEQPAALLPHTTFPGASDPSWRLLWGGADGPS